MKPKSWKSRPTLDRAIELADKHYPQLEINIARDDGDGIELFLYDITDFHLTHSIVASYNKWFDEITFYSLHSIN